MLENAQVIITLKDLEELRQESDDLKRYRKELGRAAKFDYTEYEKRAEDLILEGLELYEYEDALSKEKDLAFIRIDLKKMADIIQENLYRIISEDESYILDDVIKNKQIKIIYE